MEKILTIDGKQIPFKCTGGTALRYKMQFGKDFFGEITKMAVVNADGTIAMDYGKFDMESFYNLAWVLAKTANPSIPTPLEWLDTFESFPIMEIMPELQDMLMLSMQSKKK